MKKRQIDKFTKRKIDRRINRHDNKHKQEKTRFDAVKCQSKVCNFLCQFFNHKP